MLDCKIEDWQGLINPTLRVKVNTEKCTLSIKNRSKRWYVCKAYNLDNMLFIDKVSKRATLLYLKTIYP